jgi:tetratricopeptide (TPR) repeat protein
MHMDTPTNNDSALEQLLQLARRHEQDGTPVEAARLYHQAARLAGSASNHSDALAYADQALALGGDARPAERFALLFERERLYGLLGQREAQGRDLASLEALANSLNDDGRLALVAARQAEWRAAGGDVGGAISLATLALRLARISGADAAAAAANLTLGRMLLGQGRYDRAAFHLQQAVSGATELGDNAIRADALRSLGVLSNDREQFAQALTYYVQAEALYAGSGDERGRAKVLNNRGHVHARQGQLGQARQAWRDTARLFEKLEDIPSHIRSLINLGTLHLDLGQYAEAEQQLATALVRAEQIKLAPGIAFSGLNLGLAAVRQGRFTVALERVEKVLALSRQMGAQRLTGSALMVLGHARAGLNDPAGAGDAYWEALAIWETLALPALTAEARAGLARIAHANNAPSLALGFVEAILAQVARDPQLAGAESPIEIFLTCVHVLQRVGDARAADVLRQGHTLLQARLASVVDEADRAVMADNVRAHRDLLALAAPGP